MDHPTIEELEPHTAPADNIDRAAPIQELRKLIKNCALRTTIRREMLSVLSRIDTEHAHYLIELDRMQPAVQAGEGHAQVVSMLEDAIAAAGLETYDLPTSEDAPITAWGLRPKGGAPGRSPLADLTWTPIPNAAWKYAAPSRFEVDRKAILALLEDQYQTFTVLCGSHAIDCAINIAKATEPYRVKVADWDVVQHVLTAYVKAVAARHGTGEWIAQSVAAEQLLAVTELVQELKKQGAP